MQDTREHPVGEARSQVDQVQDTPQVETPREVRQGPLGRPVLKVLIGGLILAAIAWIGVELIVY